MYSDNEQETLEKNPARLTGVEALLKHREHTCKWIFGEPTSNNFFFCSKKAEHRSYCSEHARRVYIPLAERRKRRLYD